MRLALDVSAVPSRPAGAGRYVVEVARRVAAPGVEATLVARRGDAERWRDVAPGAGVAAVVPDGRVARLAYEALRLGTSPVAARADVWHGPHYTMPRRGSTPAVVTIHDLTFFTHPEWHEPSKVAFFTRAIRHSAAHAAALVCVSHTTAAELDAVVADHAPVVVAPLGVDHARFNPEGAGDRAALAGAGLDAGAPFVLFVGTLEPRKGLDVLLDAFDELGADDPDLELWVAGQAGWGTGPIERRLSGHRFASRVRRLGFVGDDVLAALLRAASAVAYPSRGEGFGLPVLEALACGAPVVTSAGTVMEEVAGDAAFYAAVGDAPGVARAVAEARGASRELLARTGPARAAAFTWEATMVAHREAYAMAAR